MRSSLVFALTLTLIGCRSGDPEPFSGFDSESSDTADTGGDTAAAADADADGATVAQGDCDDEDPSAYPGAEEVCDGVDNDCDGEIDDEATDASTWYEDADSDSFGDGDSAISSCEQPNGYVANTDDCDDGDASVNPLGVDLCDGVDNDCDGDVDPDDAPDATTWYPDADGDGYGDAAGADLACGEPEGYVSIEDALAFDCDDTEAAAYPGNAEVCDGIDNDCDGTVDDDPSDATTWYIDADGDGYGVETYTQESCEQPAGYVENADDCDGLSADIYPGADEYCDEVDSDCDGDIDEDAADAKTWYLDYDGDGFGEEAYPLSDCDQPSGYVENTDDCDNTDDSVYPGAGETCDDEDQDCDGTVDEDVTGATTWYADDDGDGYGDPLSSTASCDQPTGYVADGTDCDDSDASETDSATWYDDDDGDGYGDATESIESCEAPGGYVNDATDCDDSEYDVYPGAEELCDGVDNDCDGDLDEDGEGVIWYSDQDGDGFGDAGDTVEACAQPSGYVSDDSDCNDDLFTSSPASAEVCSDGEDNDCDGDVDEDGASAATYYADADGDGYGDPDSTTEACSVPSGYSEDATDCDDSSPDVYPGAEEICEDGLDNDCDDATSSCGLSGEIDLADADVYFVGERTNDSAGVSVSGAGDVDGDGYLDLIIGATGEDAGGASAGAAYLVLGNSFSSGEVDLSNAEAKFIGEALNNYAGVSVDGAGDVDGDGYDDVIIGANYANGGGIYSGVAYVVSGPVSGDLDLSSADARLLGEAAYNYAGGSVAGVGDFNDDGYDDVLVGAIYASISSTYNGAAYLVHGPVTGDLDLGSADARLLGDSAYGYAGSDVASAGDVNGDGNPDLLIGANRVSAAATYSGAAYVVYGPVTGDFNLIDADAVLSGADTYDYAGSSLDGDIDIDGDGYDDVLIGANYADAGGTYSGAAYIVYGPITENLDLDEADAILAGANTYDYAANSVSAAGDVDGDGYGDVLIGAYQNDEGGTSSGAAYVVLGPVTGEIDLAEADGVLVGEDSNDQAGVSVAGVGDMDGDGYDDVLIGASGADPSGTVLGAAYLLYGGGQ